METLNVSLFSLLIFGFLFGLQHSLDPDHLAAVTILNTKIKNPKTIWKSGIFWGLGHTFTLLLIGIFVIFLQIPIPEILSSFFEIVVAVILISLGVYSFVENHILIHNHPPGGTHAHMYPSLVVGMIHGLAGSAALMVLIVSTIHSIFLGLLYILVFGLGSIIGMGIAGAAFGLATQFFKKSLTFAVSLFSIGSGFLLLFKN